MALAEQVFQFEAHSSQDSPGKVLINLNSLWIYPNLTVGDWYAVIDYVLLTNRLKESTKNVKVLSPQVSSINHQPLILALFHKNKSDRFFIFGSNQKSASFKHKINIKKSNLELNFYEIGNIIKNPEDLFEADLKVGLSIHIPYGY